jgi:hypothetical protein
MFLWFCSPIDLSLDQLRDINDELKRKVVVLANLAVRSFYGNALHGESFVQAFVTGLSSSFSRLQEALASGDMVRVYYGVHNANVAFDNLRIALHHNFDNAQISTGDFLEGDERLILDHATNLVTKVEVRNSQLP